MIDELGRPLPDNVEKSHHVLDDLEVYIDDQIKTGTLIEYVINRAGDLTRYTSKIKRVNKKTVTLEDGHKLDINLAKLSVLHNII